MLEFPGVKAHAGGSADEPFNSEIGAWFADRAMWPDFVVQRGLRTPTGPFFARFFIGIIPGLVAEFAFMGQSTKLVMSSSPARWKGRKQIGG